jgi:drug/metabolite transporter (DMT)-like permease
MSWEKSAPALFVLLWSTGFVVARYGTHDAGPFTFLAVRMFLAAGILWLIAGALKAPKLKRIHISPALVVGVCMHALYLGGVFYAVSRGLPSGVSALIAGLHPVVTSVFGHVLLRERLTIVQWAGVSCGMAGVVLVLIERSSVKSATVTAATLTAMIIAVIGMAAGTLVQRARGKTMPLLRGTALQYLAAGVALLSLAIFSEDWDMQNTARNWFSLAWAVGILSIAAVLLMMLLLSRQAAAKVSSLFFLTPALSTIEGAILFDERLGALAVVGLAVALAGVWLTSRQPRVTTP